MQGVNSALPLATGGNPGSQTRGKTEQVEKEKQQQQQSSEKLKKDNKNKNEKWTNIALITVITTTTTIIKIITNKKKSMSKMNKTVDTMKTRTGNLPLSRWSEMNKKRKRKLR